MEKVTASIEAIEDQAQKILESAEKRANEILLEARYKARKISSSKLTLDEVQAEASRTTYKAKQQAEEMIRAAQQESSRLRSTAEAKVDRVAERILNIVIGDSR